MALAVGTPPPHLPGLIDPVGAGAACAAWISAQRGHHRAGACRTSRRKIAPSVSCSAPQRRVLMLFVCFFGFNTGSTNAMSTFDDARKAGLAAMTMMLASIAAATMAIVIGLVLSRGKGFDLLAVVNALLSGPLSIWLVIHPRGGQRTIVARRNRLATAVSMSRRPPSAPACDAEPGVAWASTALKKGGRPSLGVPRPPPATEPVRVQL